jgi:methanogenic corrinoid protein MtbC1
MDNPEKKDELTSLMADLKEEALLARVHEQIEAGVDPLVIIDRCHKGMAEVGERYEKGSYFISGLIMAGEIMRQVGTILLPLLETGMTESESGNTILLGTAEGDIHFIGKDIFKVLARCNGFTVQDLGVDVPPEKFLAAVHESKPDIVGISCLIIRAYDAMRKTIDLLRENPPANGAPRAYIIGGMLDEQAFRFIGADYWTNDAMKGVRLCQKIME